MISRQAWVRAPVDPEDQVLMTVLRRSLTSADTDVRWFHCKNAKALWLTIDQSEREAVANVTAKAKASWLAKEHGRAARMIADVVSSYDSDVFDGSDGSHNSDNDAPPTVDAYTEGYSRIDNRKREGAGEKW